MAENNRKIEEAQRKLVSFNHSDSLILVFSNVPSVIPIFLNTYCRIDKN